MMRLKNIFPDFGIALIAIAVMSAMLAFASPDKASAENKAGEPLILAEVSDTEARAGSAFDLVAATTERSLGNPNAPITVIEYASMTCAHCAAFHNEVFNDLKAAYIDTGHVYWIFREYPLDRLALRASQVARCVQPSMYFNFVEVLFSSQDRWSRSDDPMKSLANTARLAGIDQETFQACVSNQDLELHVLQTMRTGQSQWKVSSTPTFIINYGEETLSGVRSLEDFQRAFEKLQ